MQGVIIYSLSKRLIINHLKGFLFVQKVLLTQLAGLGLKSIVAFLEYPEVEHRKLLATSVVGWPCQTIQKWRVLKSLRRW